MRKTDKSPQAICRIMRTIIGFPFEILTKKGEKKVEKKTTTSFFFVFSYLTFVNCKLLKNSVLSITKTYKK